MNDCVTEKVYCFFLYNHKNQDIIYKTITEKKLLAIEDKQRTEIFCIHHKWNKGIQTGSNLNYRNSSQRDNGQIYIGRYACT